MNKLTICRAIRWTYSHLTGDTAWTVVGMYGVALAKLELGDWNDAAWTYKQAKTLLKYQIRLGNYKQAA